MNVITKDSRDLNDVSPISFQARKITFFEMKTTGIFAGDIEDMLEGNTNLINFHFNKITFNNDIDIFDIGGNLFVLEYKNKDLRDKDIDLLKQNFQENGIFSKELEEKRQIPEFDGYFEYNGKYYIIVDGLNKLTQEINPEKGIYKGVVVNPQKYFEVQNELEKISDKVGDILENEK